MKIAHQIVRFLLLWFLCYSANSLATNGQQSESYRRIVSLAPSITEILFGLGLGERIVGVTRYCKYPQEAREKQSVGGLLDPNFELIYRLNPDLVIFHEGAMNHEQIFQSMTLNTLNVESTSIGGILKSIDTLGDLFKKEHEADAIKKKIQDQIDLIRSKTKGRARPRVLVTYWRPLGDRKITEVYIAGNNTFFNDLVRITGGINAYKGPQTIISPILSAEGILQLNPDVIIEINGSLRETGFSVNEVLKDWGNLSELRAYRNNKIFVLHESYIGIPGPRIARTMRDLAKCLHPDIEWSDDGME